MPPWMTRTATAAPSSSSPAPSAPSSAPPSCDWTKATAPRAVFQKLESQFSSFVVIPATAGIHKHRPVTMDAGFSRHDSRGFGVPTNRENALAALDHSTAHTYSERAKKLPLPMRAGQLHLTARTRAKAFVTRSRGERGG